MPLAPRRGEAGTGSRQLAFVAALGLVAAALLIQLVIGADPLVLVLAGFCAVAVMAFLKLAPYSLGSWFSLVLFLQLFGTALFYKTFKLDPFDSGLLAPRASILICCLVIVALGLTGLLGRRSALTDYRLRRFYADDRGWGTTGVIFLLLGEGAAWFNYVFNGAGGTVIGAFNPLVHFKVAGMALIANHALKRGRLMTPLLAVTLAAAVFESLIFNSKSNIVLQLTAYVLAVLISPIGGGRKIRMIAVCAVMLFFADRILFPAIHLLRNDDFKTAPIARRLDMIEQAVLTERYSWSDLRTIDSGTIMDDYIRFMPTDDGFVSRFGSLGYLDLTVALGDPSVTRMGAGEFLASTLRKALPAQLSPSKDYFSLADKLWTAIDPNFQVGGMATMGTIASSRLVFGAWAGLVVVTLVLWLVLWLWQAWYGSDIRGPLVQFLLIDSVAGLIEGDIQGVFMYLVRFFWQDLLIIAAVGWLGLALFRLRSENPGAPAFRPRLMPKRWDGPAFPP